jgi:hypothetical protein
MLTPFQRQRIRDRRAGRVALRLLNPQTRQDSILAGQAALQNLRTRTGRSDDEALASVFNHSVGPQANGLPPALAALAAQGMAIVGKFS